MSSVMTTSRTNQQPPTTEQARAGASAQELEDLLSSRQADGNQSPSQSIPDPPSFSPSLSEQPFQSQSSLPSSATSSDNSTVFYLAYGSNLSAETFLGKRKIHPISALNVLVPSLKLTFDLPGIPYTEPCFANTALADKDETGAYIYTTQQYQDDEKALAKRCSYHKDRWHKGLVGVVYELSRADFAKVIATEGGGANYQDIIVLCYPLERDSQTVPITPASKPFEAHTLFAPALQPPKPGHPPSEPPSRGITRRHNCGYAQSSARYMKLITDGAEEHKLPQEYRDFLSQIRPYQITTRSQRTGKAIYTTLWAPIIMMAIKIMKLSADKEGRSPPWVTRMLLWLSFSLWVSYDTIFKRLFGDGERTQGQGPDTEFVKTPG